MANVMDLFESPSASWFTSVFGYPTAVQEAAWPAIAGGEHTLVSAPTGTGKTLSAFFVFLDRLRAEERAGMLKQELQLIYVSPLKALASDIRENLRSPLNGISGGDGMSAIEAAIRTGDTTPYERRRMIKRPPHILITTPESLYLLLTSKSGKSILCTAKAIIIDELHALIDTKRGAHLMLSIARLDKLCEHPLQRIGLSATIEPLDLAAAYLSPDPVVVAAPSVKKEVRLSIVSPLTDAAAGTRSKDPIWQELGRMVYERCLEHHSVIAFVEGRRYAEKLAYYVNLLGGEEFARTHHGSLSKEQRQETEQALREGRLRLLCATSSMELGIDVGEIDQVLQVGCPRTISGTMQRLGRAGHNPGRVSVMDLFPRTAPESLACGLTAEVARRGGVEQAHPPRLCLDILSQHLVSMATGDGYSVDDVMALLPRAYPFRGVTKGDVKSVLCMLAGDFEHTQDIPVRPRLLYDRIHEWVEGDGYSRLLAISAGGTIPDKGLYTAKTEEGVKLGELDEEFVFESQIGDRFVLGTFSWRIVSISKDTVTVRQSDGAGARLPFWKGEIKGRALKTGLAFGEILRSLEAAYEDGTLPVRLAKLGLDEAAVSQAGGFLTRQMAATGSLPDDRTILVEHFRDHTGTSQIMVHSIFGRQVNAPLSILMQQTAVKQSEMNIGCVDDEDGFLLFPYGDETLPEGLLQMIRPESARPVLEAVLPSTPLFNMTFRYNSARALMMGVKKNGRQPLWVQRLRSAQMMDSLAGCREHPLIRETRRECIEDQWDIDGVEYVLHGIRSGMIAVREMYLDLPSPMSLPFQWQAEAAMMYDYSPTPGGVQRSVEDELKQAEMIAPSSEELALVSERTRLPEDEKQLHTLLMTEGDLAAGELDLPIEWLELLAGDGRAFYIEPGLWIAAEHLEEYRTASDSVRQICEAAHSIPEQTEARLHIVRRMLRYRGPQSLWQTAERYFWPEEETLKILEELCRQEKIIFHDELYYHAKLYDKARRETVKSLRSQIKTLPSSCYARLMASRIRIIAPWEEQLKTAVTRYCRKAYPAALWESALLPGRVKEYRESMLDALLAQGGFFWKLSPDGNLGFYPYSEIDWDAEIPKEADELDEAERIIYETLQKRGASFMSALDVLPHGQSPHDTLLSLAEKGLVCADSFIPVRQWQNRAQIQKAPVRQRVNARVKALNAGRWDIVHPLQEENMKQQLESAFERGVILCRETAAACGLAWGSALETLRVWEYTGRVRRGYFIEGLSGAQFIREKDFAGTMAALERRDGEIIWISAADPDQVWGKILPHPESRGFLNVAGTAAALKDGMAAAVFERQGKVLRVFDPACLPEALTTFAAEYKKKRLYPGVKRLIVKEYPDEAKEGLASAGFIREMQDYVLYR